MLYLVPTPVGNLDDMTFRAINVLKSVALILAEDTRTSSVLLHHFDIHTPMRSHHKFNEHQTVNQVVEQLKSGMDIALISDAGTPGISDPGFLLTREAIAAGVKVQCLPGATAFVPALVDSGLPCDQFTFIGFLPVKKGRQTLLNALKDETRTMVIYESPFRVLKTFTQLQEALGPDRQASASREISKVHEETTHGTLAELVAHFTTTPPKGEFVLIVAGNGQK